jgi:multiple sugar transport system substrate-binding protein
MKRYFFTSLAILLIAAGAVFGGTTTEEKSLVKPTLVIDSRIFGRAEEQEFFFNEVLTPFAEENNINVSFAVFGNNELFQRLDVQKKTGNVTTDMVIPFASFFQDYVNAGYVEDLTPLVKEWKDRTFTPGLNSMSVFDGKQLFLPVAADVYLLCANNKALPYLPAGADVQDLTWDEFADWANNIAKGEGEGKLAVTGVPERALIYQVGGMALAYGAGFPDVSSDAAVKAWEVMVKMKDAFTPTVSTYDDLVAPMKRGEAWLVWAHVANVGDIYNSNPSQYTIAPVPKGPNGKGSIAGTHGFGIPIDSPNREMSVKLIEYITRPDVMLKLAKGGGGWIPTVSEAVDKLGDETQDEVIKMALDVLDNGVLSFIPPSYTAGGNWGKIKRVYDDIAVKFLAEGKVDTGYLKDMQAKIEGYK